VNPPVFRISELDAPVGEIVLADEEARHAIGALRIRRGETIDIVNGVGRRVRGVVANIDGPDSLVCEIKQVLDEPAPRPFMTVVQALIKDAELAVDLMTQAGVDRIVPWDAQRSVVQWRGERAAKGQAKWQSAADQAAKQSRRAWWPTVLPLHSTADVLGLLGDAQQVWLLDSDGEYPVCDPSAHDDLVIIVGPEGDVTAEERSAFHQLGARSVHLGPQVWRSSSAAMAALTMAVALRGQRAR
jgi:16S rRNA (uracil1498-N3)-methyltransferase